MEVMTLNELELTSAGGDVVAGLCVGIGTGSVIYGVGVVTQWWNPLGWVSAAFLVADAACLGYGNNSDR
ncbi:MAG TPA: hypothetical protein PKC76_08610 [Saprospiraceae bacterium]|nr:hypothetical protein [Saprospiraceae bacterium]HMP24179.1 hypothetical protein [Saprospiraceae bacterium]